MATSATPFVAATAAITKHVVVVQDGGSSDSVIAGAVHHGLALTRGQDGRRRRFVLGTSVKKKIFELFELLASKKLFGFGAVARNGCELWMIRTRCDSSVATLDQAPAALDGGNRRQSVTTSVTGVGQGAS